MKTDSKLQGGSNLMKGKFSSIWHVALALVLMLGFSLVPVVPAMAQVAAPTVVSAATNAPGTVISITFNKQMADPAGKQAQFTYQIGGAAAQNFSAASLNPNTA